MALIHKFMFDDLKIVVDVNSGSIHLVDEMTWAYLDLLATGLHEKEALAGLATKYEPGELAEMAVEVAALTEEGVLFSSDQTGQDYRPAANPAVKALCVHVSHDCNLNCTYCFAGAGRFGGERLHMPLAIGKKAVDFLLEASGSKNNCEIDFFGGEPLLNYPVVRELVHYGQKQAGVAGKKLKFTLTTNGVLLDREIENFLNKQEMSLVLSMDGRREINDLMRPTAGGQGTYDRVMANLKRFCTSRDHRNYYLRGTFTRHNLDFSRDVLHLAAEGFKMLSVEPVVAPPGADFAFQPDDLPKLFAEYEELARVYLLNDAQGQGFDFFHFNVELHRGPCLPKRLTGCGAGNDYLAVTPEGELYPCHQFVGQVEFKLGDLDRGIVNKELQFQFQQAHVYNKPACRECWARFYCSGGCHASNFFHRQDLFQVYELGCALTKKRLECAIYVQVQKVLASQL